MYGERAVDPGQAISPSRRWTLLIALSFVPLLVKAVGYTTIGSYLPLLVFCFFAGLVAWGLSSGSRAEVVAIRAWAAAMALWGAARLGLWGLHLLLGIPDAHVAGQFTMWYMFVSIALLTLGVYLYPRCRRAAKHPSGTRRC